MNPPSNQNNQPKITSIDLNPPLCEKKLIVLPKEEESLCDRQFDLTHLHKHKGLVSCCDHRTIIIKSLQDELTSKDEQIALLEEKLVQMSLELELANSSNSKAKKASEDELRGSDSESPPSVSVARKKRKNEEVSVAPMPVVPTLPSLAALYAPARHARKDCKRSRSEPVDENEGENEGEGDDKSVTPLEMHPAPERRGGFRLAPLATNWYNANNGNNDGAIDELLNGSSSFSVDNIIMDENEVVSVDDGLLDMIDLA